MIPALLQAFEAHAAAAPAAPAVRCGDTLLSYGELNTRADALAGWLHQQGCATGELIAVEALASEEFVLAMLGVIKAGCAWVPVDPDPAAPRRADVLDIVQPRLVLDQRTIQVAGLSGCAPVAGAADVAPESLCYVMFTSGSAGQPKGVQVTHANVAGLFSGVAEIFGLRRGATWAALHAPTFGFSVWETWGPLVHGGVLEIVPAELRGNPHAWSAQVAAAGVNVLSLTPSGFRQWVHSGVTPAALPELQLIVLSGEAVDPELIEAWRASGASPDLRVISTYALTETAGRVCWHELVHGQTEPAGIIGRPTADAHIELCDASGAPVAPGSSGEIWVAGPMVAPGYFGAPDLSRERFVTRGTGSSARRFYRTGDFARLSDDDELVFAGRDDGQVKLRGHRIELAEIEAAIRQHPAVRAAAVVVTREGAGEQLHAFTVPADADDTAVQFWPSLGEYQVYDELLYDFMSADERRVASYRAAFERCAQNKVVLDIGTGKDAILARMAAAAGARHVYAVEVLDDAFAAASALISRLGLDDVITVLHGDMQAVTIPEPVEVCTQGIVGNIGSSDGIAPIWNSARHVFAPDCSFVPAVCTTYIAPAALPPEAVESPAFSRLAAHYTRKIFAAAGREFDVRLCIRNFPRQNLVAPPAEFEVLDFAAELPVNYSGAAQFEIVAAGRFDGFLLWTQLDNGTAEAVDFLEHQQAWLPVWLPLAEGGVELAAGDKVAVQWRCATPAGQIFPDYFVDATVQSAADEHAVSCVTRHFETNHGATALHRQLLSSLQRETSLADWLQGRLPDYMQPGRWTELPALPLNSNAKLDRQRLAAWQDSAEKSAAAAGDAADSTPADPFTHAVHAIWVDVLERPQLGCDDDFFAAGGDSILAVRLTTEIQRFLDDTVFLAALFEAPTAAAYAEWLRTHHPAAVEQWLDAAPNDNTAARDITAGPRDGSPAPLAFAQQSLYFLNELYPDNTAANEQFLVRMTGPVDSNRLEQAWYDVLGAHDILRTHFGKAPEPFQQAASAEVCAANAPLEFVDLRALADEAIEQRLADDAQRAVTRAFDLAAPPLLRGCVYRLAAERWVLMVTAHHIVADGMCVGLIRDALARAYAGDLVMPALQYADFARWQTASLDETRIEAGLQWWRQQLAGHAGQPPSLARNSAAEAAEARFAFTVPAHTADALRSLGRSAGATPFMVMLAAWRAWLSRCLMERDLLVGSPVTLRREESLSGMLGCMVNNVVFRNAVRPGQSFAELLQAERDQALTAMDNSHVPFERVVEAVQPERHLNRHPLFQLLFLFEDRTRPAVEAAGINFTSDVLPVDRASYWDIELSVTDQGAGEAMPAFIGVRRDIYDAAAVAWWAQGFVAMLEAIATTPDLPVAELPLLTETQRHRMIVEWNDTRFPVSAADTLHGMVYAQGARSPAATAIEEGGRRISYGELLATAGTCAAALAAHGVGRGDIVGLNMPRSAESVALQLAILQLGAAWLPLDPAYPAERLQFMASDAAPRVIVCAHDSPLHTHDNALAWQDLLVKAEPGASPSATDVCGDDIAYVLYTSGSTGKPKGVLATHASAVSRCRWMWQTYDFRSTDVFGQRTSLNFVDSVWEIFGALGHGARVNIAPVAAEANPEALHAWLQTAGISHTALVPSLLTVLLDECELRGVPAALHTLITSGESLSRRLAARALDTLAGCRLLNTYGTSETWDVSCYEVSVVQEQGVVPVGRPIANTSLCILDDSMQPVPPGVEGELYAGGAGLVREYLGNPQLTAEKFVGNPLAELTHARLYKTGDRARFRADGNVELLGRRDRQIKLRGIRIEAAEIEAQARALDEVSECAVVYRSLAEDDLEWLALYIVPAAESLVPATVRAHLQSRLPRMMVPADICILEQLPLTPSGKVDVDALPAGAELPPVREAYAPPRDELESLLADVWARELGVEQVGRDDNFFALRGHSLLATRVIARTGELLGVDVPLQCLFESPTVAGLADAIRALEWAAEQQPVAANTEREVFRL